MSPFTRHQQEIIFIDVYTTQPQHQMRVADLLAQMLAVTKNLYGNAYGRWLSGSIHKSVDGTRVVVYECFSDRGTAQTIHAELSAIHSQWNLPFRNMLSATGICIRLFRSTKMCKSSPQFARASI